MRAATADQIRNRMVFVQLPGSDLQIECRRPDLLALIANNVLPLSVFHEVLNIIATWNESDKPPTGEEMAAAAANSPRAWGQFIDRWAAAAAVAPRVVLTEAEADADRTTLWIEDLEFETRLEIMRLTNRGLRSAKVKTAVTDFRRLQPDGAGAGSDGAAVRSAAVSAAADERPAGGA